MNRERTVVPFRTESSLADFAVITEGGPRAAALLFDRFGGDVNGWVRRLLGNDADHDDLVQEIMLAALKAVKTVNDPSKLRSWLRRITINRVRMEMRRRKSRRRNDHREFVDERFEGATAREDKIAQRDLLRAAYAAIEQLPVDERIAFILRRIEGLSLDEVAENLGCSLATAKRRLRKAIDRFNRLVADNPGLGTLIREDEP
ncbi:MAG: sigma-70 family RNA polymerase sigma factor [Myxococcota bacterium]